MHPGVKWTNKGEHRPATIPSRTQDPSAKVPSGLYGPSQSHPRDPNSLAYDF